jgi:hypothetical protein
MKILYARSFKNYLNDYVADGVFHGLCEIPGLEVVDVERLWHMYSNEFTPIGTNDITKFYGRGFTMFGTMKDNIVDRTNIEQKIKDRYFDLVIFNSTDNPTPYMDLVIEHYPPNSIITLDGSDWFPFPGGPREAHHRKQFLLERTIYFKREYYDKMDRVYPISCSIPASKCRTEPQVKTKAWALSIPKQENKAEQYTFANEKDYYDDYSSSLFGLTVPKSGWESLRHYEIMAARCIPIFRGSDHLLHGRNFWSGPGLETCPELTLTTLPKELLIHARNRVDESGADYFMPGNPGWQEYQDLEGKIHEHFMKHCTTVRVAEYVLDLYKKINQE